MILLPLWVLLWKYVKTRFVRYCHTFWETFGGVSVFVILFLVHLINLFKLHPPVNQHKTHDAFSRRMMASNEPTIRIFYSPLNDFTQELMTRAEAHLDQDKGVLPKHRWVFESISHPIQFYYDLLKNSDGFAEVRFKDESSLKTDLKYSLYAVSDEVENELNELFGGLLRTITPKEEIAPPFLPQLQWAIDKSFLEMLGNEPIKQEIKMSATRTFVKGELLTLHRFLVVCTILGPLPFFLVYSSRLILERKTGMRELMKHSGIYSNVLRFSHVLEALLVGILYSSAVTIFLKITWQPLLPESNPFIILFTLIWHFVNTMCFAFITTVLSQDSQHAVCLGLVLYLSTFILDFLWHSYKEYTLILCCILPHAPIYLFWNEVTYLERLGLGTQFPNLYTSHSDYSVVIVWCFLCIQLLVTLTISWYLDLTRPGFYGVPKRWNFFFKKKYWHSEIKRRIIQLPSFLIKREEIHFEKKPKKAEIAVQILNVSKVFKQRGPRSTQVIALDSVSFDCYKGEVTMLLGGNGAGKTTLMLIVAGMFTATEGTVFVEGLDVANKEKEIRHNVGLCMQENVFFRYLTVKENIMFFKKLQGRSTKGFSVQQLLKSFKLAKVADCYGSQLSKGNMRCLQVACVLAADADVLVLDEPTTAMDLEMRHHLWDVLMVLRGKKTILMTTTCLEEANVLGDRIAILDKGVLKCHGSPTFLKNIIGTSFTLAITIQDASRLYELKEMVDTIIPDLKCRIHEMRRIDFLLPTKEFQRFPDLFEALEDQKDHFGIILIDVAMFMEEVFSQFIETGATEQYEIKRHRSNYRKFHVMGYKLVFKQIGLLIKRLFIYTMKTKGFFFLLRIGVPIICFLIITLTSNYALRQHKLFSHQIGQVQRTGDTRLVYDVAPFRRSGLFDIVLGYQDISPVYSADIDTEFRRLSEGYLNQDTLGLKITDNYTKIYHSQDPRATSKSVNLFSNVYRSMYMPHHNNSIRTTYETLPKPLAGKLREVKSKFLCLKWSSWITFLSIIPLTPTIMLCIVERNYGIRDNHIMAGCSPKIHWGAKLLVHMVVFAIMIMIPTIFIAYSLDYDSTFIYWPFSFAAAGLLFTFGLAFHSYLYLMSYILEENHAISKIYIASLLFGTWFHVMCRYEMLVLFLGGIMNLVITIEGVIFPMFIAILELLWQKSVYFGIPYFILMVVGRTTPQFTLGVGLAKLVLRARLNAFCVLNRQQCPDLEFDEEAFDANVCCRGKNFHPFPYLVSYETGLYDLLNLAGQFVVFATLVILLEYRIPQYLYEQFSFSGYKEPAQTFNANNVNQEISYVRTAARERNYDGSVLLVRNIHKDFKTAKLVLKQQKVEKLNVVRGVSFATKLGECLAIIGPQSAGKTSLLKMLSGTMVMTRGDSCINGIYIRRNRMKVLIALSFFATGSYQRPVGDISGHSVAQPTVSVVIKQITNLLNLPHLQAKYIKFPRTSEERNDNKLKFFNKFKMPGVLGCIDCTHVAIVRPVENEERYYCRKQYHSLNVQLYMHKISLSSRTGGLDYFMTGAQNLVFIAKLKGYSEEVATLFAYKALKCMGLLANDPLVWNYSSGCLRRLSLCSALVLGPTVAFLDEPMRGVDASSKPLVANALQRLKGLPASVIVTESTLDWRLLEPAYDRIAIMAKGQFATLGPAPEILESIAKGYSARIKLNMVTAYRRNRVLRDKDSINSESETELEVLGAAHSDKSVMFATTLNDLKKDFLKTFTSSRLCKEHLSMLFYIIEDEYKVERYSDMFRKLQALKEKYSDLIEDYYLSSVTVEDVFWRFQYEKGTMEHLNSISAIASTSAAKN